MVGVCKARRSAALALAGLLWGIVLISATLGQEGEDLVALTAELERLDQAGKYVEATEIAKRLLANRERTLGVEHSDVGRSLHELAMLYRAQGLYAEAEPLLKRSLAIFEKTHGPEHPDEASALNDLGRVYRDQGRYAEAEPLIKRSLNIAEKALGAKHRDVAVALNNLAGLFRDQGRDGEAEPLYQRSLIIREQVLGPEHLEVALSLNNLARLYRDQRRFTEAEPLFKRSLLIREKVLGPDRAGVATALSNLAELYRVQGRYAEAEPLFERSLAIREKMLGSEHPDVGTSLNNLALLHRARGRFTSADPLFRRSLSIFEKALGPDHPSVNTLLDNLADLAFGDSNWAEAADYWRRSTDIIKRRTRRGLSNVQGEASGGEAQRLRRQFWGLIKATYRSAAQNPSAILSAEMFETAQWAHASEAATSLAQMAARSAKGSPELSGLVRERQDLVGEWRGKDKLLVAASAELPTKRNADAEKALADRLSAIDARLAEIDKRLAKDFPDYAALASPEPVSVPEVQAQLGDDEALVLFLDTPGWRPLPEETFIWVVTKLDVHWLRTELGTPALTREVAALRCGLDETAWYGDGAGRCTELLMHTPDKLPGIAASLPFDHTRAHHLYTALFGGVQEAIKGKHLLLVLSGPLTQLPFQVLVTESPKSAEHKTVRWLARDHALTVLPAASSFKALRRISRPSAALRPFIGFGNPLLDGQQDDRQYGVYYKEQAALARAEMACALTAERRTKTSRTAIRGFVPLAQRSGLVDPAELRFQSPLPETADELCAVARGLKADLNEVRLGKRATERELKSLSTAGRLADYRIVHFATHGALSGQLAGTHEPGLILTPPAVASDDDDGYLSASETAGLKLDADWVILSACNTAAGAGNAGEAGAEALSGLARAFFYAQARALLVSHWAVDSDATVRLITSAVDAISQDKSVGRAEALRRAMLDMIDSGAKHHAHPAYWAPFVLVGEGATGR